MKTRPVQGFFWEQNSKETALSRKGLISGHQMADLERQRKRHGQKSLLASAPISQWMVETIQEGFHTLRCFKKMTLHHGGGESP